MDSAVVAAVVGPVITALVGMIGWWLRETRRRRDREHGLQQALERAHQQITMIEGWLRAYREVATPEEYEEARRDARDQLLEARALADEIVVAQQPGRKARSTRQVVEQLLLRDSMNTKATRIVGVFYYLSLAWLLLWVTTGSLFAASAGASSESLLSAAGFGLGIFAMSLACGVAPVLPLYAWLSSASRAQPSAGTGPQPRSTATSASVPPALPSQTRIRCNRDRG